MKNFPPGLSSDDRHRFAAIIHELQAEGAEVTPDAVLDRYDQVYGIAPLVSFLLIPFLEWFIPFVLNHLVSETE